MITDSKKWRYLAVKKITCTALTSKHFYCFNCFHSYSTEDKLKKHKDACENHDYCYMEMPNEDNNTCHNYPWKLSTTKINKHTASGYLLFTNRSFDTTKNKLNYYRGKNCMKNFRIGLRQHATKIINYEKKEMIPLLNEEKKYIVSKKYVIYAKKNLVLMTKKHQKVRDYCHYTGKYRGAAHDICNLRYKKPKRNSCSVS